MRVFLTTGALGLTCVLFMMHSVEVRALCGVRTVTLRLSLIDSSAGEMHRYVRFRDWQRGGRPRHTHTHTHNTQHNI